MWRRAFYVQVFESNKKNKKKHIILHKRKLKDCRHNSPQFSAGSFYYRRRWIIISTPAIPNNTILQHHCLLCFMVEYRWGRKNIQMKHYPVLRHSIHSAVEGFISSLSEYGEYGEVMGKLFAESMWLLYNCSVAGGWIKTRMKHVFRDGLNCGGTDSYPDGHICAVSKCASCKRGMLMFKLLQQQVYRPQTTPVWSGARSQSVNWLAEEQLLHQVTKQIWRGSSSVFIAIMVLALKHIGVKLCMESTAVSVFCTPPARDPWKGSFKDRVTLHYTLPMGWPLHFLYFCAPVLAFSWGSRRVNLSTVLRFCLYNLWAASQRLCWQAERRVICHSLKG